jgi:hypothetical protein
VAVVVEVIERVPRPPERDDELEQGADEVPGDTPDPAVHEEVVDHVAEGLDDEPLEHEAQAPREPDGPGGEGDGVGDEERGQRDDGRPIERRAGPVQTGNHRRAQRVQHGPARLSVLLGDPGGAHSQDCPRALRPGPHEIVSTSPFRRKVNFGRKCTNMRG